MKQLTHAQYAQLIKKAQKGDSNAFAKLYAATVASQLYFATSFLKDSALAEDAVQETYLSLYRNLHKIEDGKYFIAYLRRICYNICVDFFRKRARSAAVVEDDVIYIQQDEDVEANPEESYDAIEQSGEIQQALAKIPEDLRAAFLMRYLDEMKIKEIAQVMEISESTVKRYINKAAKLLKTLL